MKVTVNDTTLIDIANAIREKGYSEDVFYPAEMGDAIRNLPSGGNEPTDEELTYWADCSNLFAKATWEIDRYGDRVTTRALTNIDNMFNGARVSIIPFELNCTTAGTVSMIATFTNSNIEYVPKLNDCKPSNLQTLFSTCRYLREIPEDFESWIDWSAVDNATTTYTGNMSGLFSNCNSLRNVPMNIYTHGNPTASYSYSIYYNAFSNCTALDEVIGMPFPHTNTTWTSNALSSTVSYCHRLKNFTFALNDGQPYEVSWKNQVLDFSNGVGYAGNFQPFNSGITADKEVKDDATYQALKNDPDWYTQMYHYSRYNHDSAVATINSLPITPGSNTIKFTGRAGSSTDGGAINTLTAEEIAVATEKGWTVTLS